MYKDDLFQYLDIVMTEYGDDLTEIGAEYAEIYAFIESLEDNVYYPTEYVVENMQIMTQTKSESEGGGCLVSEMNIEPVDESNTNTELSKSLQENDTDQSSETISSEKETVPMVEESDTVFTAELTRQFIAGLYSKPRPIAKTFQSIMSGFFNGDLVSETLKDECHNHEILEESIENQEEVQSPPEGE